uniref:Uncharacterized protein n=1 Tax=Setaria viridis TaxID=4556 RepID=A0A4V6DAF8_SETVI|nr:hypothetical protein SEVIR_3G418300v2 [Setaria viridis]
MTAGDGTARRAPSPNRPPVPCHPSAPHLLRPVAAPRPRAAAARAHHVAAFHRRSPPGHSPPRCDNSAPPLGHSLKETKGILPASQSSTANRRRSPVLVSRHRRLSALAQLCASEAPPSFPPPVSVEHQDPLLTPPQRSPSYQSHNSSLPARTRDPHRRQSVAALPHRRAHPSEPPRRLQSPHKPHSCTITAHCATPRPPVSLPAPEKLHRRRAWTAAADSHCLAISAPDTFSAPHQDGTYELLPTAKEGSAELHHTDAEQEPNEASNELLTNVAHEGKLWSIILF